MKRKIFVILIILLFVSGCSGNKNQEKNEKTISELKVTLKEYSEKVEKLTHENNSLLERFTKECVDGKDHIFGSGGVVAENIVPSIVDGKDLFVYTFKNFQSDSFNACYSQKKLAFEKGSRYEYECDEKSELVKFELFK